jgi:MoxR-like ATPase
MSPEEEERAERFVPVGGNLLFRAINAALLLRRPLLVRGDPGLGKSSLSLHLARHFGLGRVLRWEINSRTTLESGLYQYDAVAHLHGSKRSDDADDVGQYIRLGPLGTALLPTARPRVLLIDEFDKAAYDLPNDLLHVFEEGHFVIPELARLHQRQRVYPADAQRADDRVELDRGLVGVCHHPIIVVTTNDEREFPEAFLRRVVTLHLPEPSPELMGQILKNWFGDRADEAERILADVAPQRTAWKLQLAQLGLGGLSIDDAKRALAHKPDAE